jgi:hypothetical protein
MRFTSKIALLSAVSIVVLFFFVIPLLRNYLSSGDYSVVSTTKVSQLTGTVDREWPARPTGQILSRVPAGVTGTDLGFPFEHGSRLYFLFGDTRETDPDLCAPDVCGTKASPKINVHNVSQQLKLADSQADWDSQTRGRQGADSIAHVPIQSDPLSGLPLQFETDRPDNEGDRFHAVTLDGNVLGNFETPVSGFSDGFETIYAFFTVRDKPPGCTRPDGCSLGDPQPGGQSKLAASTDQGRTFRSLWTVSKRKFQWPVPVVVDGKLVPGLPSELTQTKALLIFGTGNENAKFGVGYPYLAVASMNFFGVQGSWKYYGGTASDGTVSWKDNEDDAVELPPFGSALYDRMYGSGYHRCVGQFSVQYDRVLAKWMMMYGCGNDPAIYNPRNGRGIFLRMADAPWGPWTSPQLVFDPGNRGYCYFMHRQDAGPCPAGSPNPADLGFRDDKDPEKNAWGGEYDACLLPPRYDKYTGGSLTLYWVMSTWNPYQAVLMKTEIRRPPWWERLVMKDRARLER